MSVSELKEEVHKLVDSIDDEPTLARLRKAACLLVEPQRESLWQTLSTEEQRELREAIEESFDPRNLLSHEEARKQIDQWLGK